MCACVGIICVRFFVMYMVGSAAFYWKEALIVAVKPYLNRFVRTGPLESLYAELFTYGFIYHGFPKASLLVCVCVCVCRGVCVCVCRVCVCRVCV